MFETLYIRNLPDYGKLFVAIFVILMLFVSLWATWLYTVEKGEVDQDNLPAYLQNEGSITQPERQSTEESDDDKNDKLHSDLRENLGLAHTHINGQTLLYFAIGLVFLFTSVKPKMKKIIFWTFGLSIISHTIGLSAEGFYSIFDDILALSGVVLLITIAYMVFLIIVDLFKEQKFTRTEGNG